MLKVKVEGFVINNLIIIVIQIPIILIMIII